MKMLLKCIMILVWLLYGSFFAGITHAQGSRTDGGMIVTEESLLNPAHKQIEFIVVKDIPDSARVELQTYSSEGIVNRFTTLMFPKGLQKYQVIPVWNGDLNLFSSTPWFKI